LVSPISAFCSDPNLSEFLKGYTHVNITSASRDWYDVSVSGSVYLDGEQICEFENLKLKLNGSSVTCKKEINSSYTASIWVSGNVFLLSPLKLFVDLYEPNSNQLFRRIEKNFEDTNPPNKVHVLSYHRLFNDVTTSGSVYVNNIQVCKFENAELHYQYDYVLCESTENSPFSISIYSTGGYGSDFLKADIRIQGSQSLFDRISYKIPDNDLSGIR
jgi:hypothetical protein